jgi:putative membrane-bound dehydrogenase-like protein
MEFDSFPHPSRLVSAAMKRLLPLLLISPALAGVAPPQVLDPNLKIEFIAAEPDINTPIGIAADKKGRLFVVENNTHQVRPDYKGPKSDRIRLFQQDAAGKWQATTFAEGFRNAMCLEFDPDGVLHLTLRDKLLKLEDTNNDGVCDKQTELMRWETKGDYPHNGLSGMTFASDGWLYVGSGENLQVAYTAIGSDGKKIEYQPGGANIFRIHRDGTGLEITATGLWNGFGLECDAAGRILCVDNDPDSCPPNRLLHIVPGGDYGFNMTYGRAGTHPFQCWNGEIPGTLPMICGTGEGATDILDMRRTSFRRPGLNVIVTSWGDNQIEAYKLVSKGASVTLGERSVLARGDASFRPACFAVGPDGSVFITDWADREYSVHGKGRIWKLSAKEASQVKAEEALVPATGATLNAEELRKEPMGLEKAIARLFASDDPFVRAKGMALHWERAATALADTPVDQIPGTEGRVLAHIMAALKYPRMKVETVPGSFKDPEKTRRELLNPSFLKRRLNVGAAPEVRITIIAAAELRLTELIPDIEAAIKKHSTDREVFRTGIAALELIDKDASAKPSGSLDGLLLKIITDAAQPAAIRSLAMLSLNNRDGSVPTLLPLLKDKDPAVAAAAARTLGAVNKTEVIAPLRDIALNSEAPRSLRLDALAALSGKPEAELLPLLPLLTDKDNAVGREAVRTLRSALGNINVRTAMEKVHSEPLGIVTGPGSVMIAAKHAALGLALGKPFSEIRPATDEQWHEALRSGKGDPDGGRRVFFSAAANCATCHIAEGRGAKVGPDLSTIARSADREKLVASILTPSREIGPLYVMKTATLLDGTTVTGIQSDKETGGRVDIIQPGGLVEKIPHNKVAKIDVSPVSLMPEALELALTVQEFRDLIAYMETLR